MGSGYLKKTSQNETTEISLVGEKASWKVGGSKETRLGIERLHLNLLKSVWTCSPINTS